MKNAIALLALLALGGCSKTDSQPWPELPATHTLDIEEMYGQTFMLEWLYDPNQVEPPFDTWRGYVEIDLRKPDAGLPDLPFEIRFGHGFAEVSDGCLDDGRGSWNYNEETGMLRADFETESGTTVGFEGIIERSYFYIPPTAPDGTRIPGVPTIGHDDGSPPGEDGQGNWVIVKGEDCTSDDFSVGTVGRWRTVNALFLESTAEPEPEEPGTPIAFAYQEMFNEHGESVGTITTTITSR